MGRGRNDRVEWEARIRKQAARTIADVFDRLYEGAFAVDLDARITWMDAKFRALIGWNGMQPLEGRAVEEVIPQSRMREVIETGRPTLVDIFELGERQVVVSRIPLTDEDGRPTGAMGVILYDRLQALKPLVGRVQRLQRDLADAQRRLAESRRAKYGLAAFVGAGEAVRRLKRDARRAAERTAPVLLLGETGTGKELLAHALHAAGPRADRPMVRINVAAIPETLIEAELFGTAPGAFTGADRKGRAGKVQLADGGTLFLDEVGDLPPALQPKLLRVLEEQEVEPLGSDRLVQVDVRVIAATSRDLPAMVADGRFRADLYYRLNVLPLVVPPLRERPEDLPLLVDALLERMRDQAGGGPAEVDAAALDRLARHAWPGNVRELRNMLEQAAVRAEAAEVLTLEAFDGLLPDAAGIGDGGGGGGGAGGGESGPRPGGARPAPEAVRPLADQLAEAERRAIREALAATGGVKLHAARLLGISRAQFYEKLARHGLTEALDRTGS